MLPRTLCKQLLNFLHTGRKRSFPHFVLCELIHILTQDETELGNVTFCTILPRVLHSKAREFPSVELAFISHDSHCPACPHRGWGDLYSVTCRAAQRQALTGAPRQRRGMILLSSVSSQRKELPPRSSVFWHISVHPLPIRSGSLKNHCFLSLKLALEP